MSQPAIETAGLRKSFGDKLVLDGVDLRVAPGTVYALLGPNGAGKTTIVRILSTLLKPGAGTVRVGGHDVAADPDAVRALIGVTGQFSAVDNLLTGVENLHLMGDCTTSAGARCGAAPSGCSPTSTSWRRAASRSRCTRVACAAASTWR